MAIKQPVFKEDEFQEALNKVINLTKSYEEMIGTLCKYRVTVAELTAQLETCQERADEFCEKSRIPSTELREIRSHTLSPTSVTGSNLE